MTGDRAVADGSSKVRRSDPPDVVDIIAALAPKDDVEVGTMIPGRVELELGGASFDQPADDRPLDVAMLARHGDRTRVGVRLAAVRFAGWVPTKQLFGVLDRDIEIGAALTLHSGARVRILGRKNKHATVRYVGALEVETTIADEALVDRGVARSVHMIPTGRRKVPLILGTIVRSEPKWEGRELAKVATHTFIDQVKEIDGRGGWVEIEYRDTDISLRGFASRQLPPGPVHKPKDVDPPATIVANGKATAGTCLYARRDGEPIGYTVADVDAAIDPLDTGWWTVSLDTPWGPIPFVAKGLTRPALASCGPTAPVPTP